MSINENFSLYYEGKLTFLRENILLDTYWLVFLTIILFTRITVLNDQKIRIIWEVRSRSPAFCKLQRKCFCCILVQFICSKNFNIIKENLVNITFSIRCRFPFYLQNIKVHFDKSKGTIQVLFKTQKQCDQIQQSFMLLA